MEEQYQEHKLFSLTAVHYPPGDQLGKLLALITLTPIFLVFLYVVLILIAQRKAEIVSVFIGQLVNVLVVLVLKVIIAQERPSAPHQKYLEDHGMPSNHASTTWWIVGVFAWQFVSARRKSRQHNSREIGIQKALLSGFLFSGILASAVCWSRVYLGYHTTDQVVVGAITGFLFGVLWSMLLHRFIVPIVKYISQIIGADRWMYWCIYEVTGIGCALDTLMMGEGLNKKAS